MRRTPLSVIFGLFLLSGATSLVYEVLWLRQLILIFGSTQFATSTVLATFMGGLALGAFVAGRWMTGKTIRPLRLYGYLEIGIGVYALAVPFLFRSLSPIYQAVWDAGASDSFFVLSLAKFAGIAVVLLPPTVLMGASLPALALEVAADPERIGGQVGGLYAINTFGAVAGTFIAGFVAIPAVGVQQTLWTTALINGLLGLVAILLARGLPVLSTATDATRAAGPVGGPSDRRVKVALWIFGLSGFGALVLEVAWTRVLALIIGSSVYAFSLMLLAFLIGLASGSAVFSAWLRRRPQTDPGVLLATLLGFAGLASYATTFLFNQLVGIVAQIFFVYHPSADKWLVIQFALGLMIMFPATFALGGIFPAVLQIHARTLASVSGSVGTVYASNTVGTILGAALAGFVLIPTFGAQPTVLLVAVLEMTLAVLALFLVVEKKSAIRTALVPIMVVGIALTLFVRPAWDTILMNSGPYMNLHDVDPEVGWSAFKQSLYEDHELVMVREGLTATVFVADQPKFNNRYLSVNGKIEASTNADLETQLMASHLPLLLHGNAQDVMVIGLASGITVAAAATHPVRSIRVVEVERVMEEAARLFAEANNNVLDDPRVELSFNDARNELEFSGRSYDVIISEPSNPWMTVAANLFTEDFFRMAKTRVRPGGVFAQWVQNYYLPTEDLRSIIAAFKSAFPHVLIFETFEGVDLLMMGSQEPLTIDLEAFGTRMGELQVMMDLRRVSIREPVDVLNLFRLGTAEVDRLVEGAPRNTDDNARVEFSAPKTFGTPTLEENLALIHGLAADPFDYVDPPFADPEAELEARLRIARQWLWRGDWDLAIAAARKLENGPHGDAARRIIADSQLARDIYYNNRN